MEDQNRKNDKIPKSNYNIDSPPLGSIPPEPNGERHTEPLSESSGSSHLPPYNPSADQSEEADKWNSENFDSTMHRSSGSGSQPPPLAAGEACLNQTDTNRARSSGLVSRGWVSDSPPPAVEKLETSVSSECQAQKVPPIKLENPSTSSKIPECSSPTNYTENFPALGCFRDLSTRKGAKGAKALIRARSPGSSYHPPENPSSDESKDADKRNSENFDCTMNRSSGSGSPPPVPAAGDAYIDQSNNNRGGSSELVICDSVPVLPPPAVEELETSVSSECQSARGKEKVPTSPSPNETIPEALNVPPIKLENPSTSSSSNVAIESSVYDGIKITLPNEASSSSSTADFNAYIDRLLKEVNSSSYRVAINAYVDHLLSADPAYLDRLLYGDPEKKGVSKFLHLFRDE